MPEFGDHFGDFERIDLATTFRCSDRVAAVATDFVLRNSAQIHKTVRAIRHADRTSVHVGLSGEEGLSLLKEWLLELSLLRTRSTPVPELRGRAAGQNRRSGPLP